MLAIFHRLTKFVYVWSYVSLFVFCLFVTSTIFPRSDWCVFVFACVSGRPMKYLRFAFVSPRSNFVYIYNYWPIFASFYVQIIHCYSYTRFLLQNGIFFQNIPHTLMPCICMFNVWDMFDIHNCPCVSFWNRRCHKVRRKYCVSVTSYILYVYAHGKGDTHCSSGCWMCCVTLLQICTASNWINGEIKDIGSGGISNTVFTQW